MQLEVLVSCMNQKDSSLVENSSITTDVLLINQCNRDDLQVQLKGNQTIRMISTTQRGLSKSRNMAIENATGDICLLCDDDERLTEDYSEKIMDAFKKYAKADVIAFQVINHKCSLRTKEQKLGYFKCLKISSCQIAFRTESIRKKNVLFNVFMGAGTGNGAGEENKFLIDCYKSGLRLYYIPVEIAELKQKTSTWFQGYDERFFYLRGIATRYMLGLFYSIIYAIYYSINKRKLFAKSCSVKKALFWMLIGIKNNDIKKQILKQEKI